MLRFFLGIVRLVIQDYSSWSCLDEERRIFFLLFQIFEKIVRAQEYLGG